MICNISTYSLFRHMKIIRIIFEYSNLFRDSNIFESILKSRFSDSDSKIFRLTNNIRIRIRQKKRFDHLWLEVLFRSSCRLNLHSQQKIEAAMCHKNTFSINLRPTII